MTKLFFICLIFISHAWSAEKLSLEFRSQELRQGALVKAKLFVPSGLVNIPVQKLKGETSGETIYFHQISPLLKKEGSSIYESDVQVIFTRVPESSHIVMSISGQTVDLEWNSVQVIPVETPEGMLWADFTAPDFLEGKLTWIWIILLVTVLVPCCFFFWRKFDRHSKEKSRRQRLIAEFRACQNYEEVVALWKRKRVFMKDFPHLESCFPAFETVLFKYQFKPLQSDSEKNEVMNAYRTLIEQSEGGFRGV